MLCTEYGARSIASVGSVFEHCIIMQEISSNMHANDAS